MVQTVNPVKPVPAEGADAFYFSSLNGDGYSMTFNGLLPDHNYRLVVDAPINTGIEGAETYMRNFISKSFYTDSVGVYMEAAASTVNSVSLKVSKQPYSTAAVAKVKLYDGRASTQSGSGQIATQEAIDLMNGAVSVTFDTYRDTNPTESLHSNTTYFARVEVTNPQALTISQILPLTTLKTRASLGAPSLTPNREDGGTPDNVWDFLLATSATTAGDNCWLTMLLGSTLREDGGLTPPRLLNLAPKLLMWEDLPQKPVRAVWRRTSPAVPASRCTSLP